jgi:hypothetical protein
MPTKAAAADTPPPLPTDVPSSLGLLSVPTSTPEQLAAAFVILGAADAKALPKASDAACHHGMVRMRWHALACAGMRWHALRFGHVQGAQAHLSSSPEALLPAAPPRPRHAPLLLLQDGEDGQAFVGGVLAHVGPGTEQATRANAAKLCARLATAEGPLQALLMASDEFGAVGAARARALLLAGDGSTAGRRAGGHGLGAHARWRAAPGARGRPAALPPLPSSPCHAGHAGHRA